MVVKTLVFRGNRAFFHVVAHLVKFNWRSVFKLEFCQNCLTVRRVNFRHRRIVKRIELGIVGDVFQPRVAKRVNSNTKNNI